MCYGGPQGLLVSVKYVDQFPKLSSIVKANDFSYQLWLIWHHLCKQLTIIEACANRCGLTLIALRLSREAGEQLV